MFWPDVVGLRQFYASPCGSYAAQLMRLAIRRFWPEARDEAMAGIGFATPYLSLFLAATPRIVAFMPAGQGVLHWPSAGANRTVLTDETLLPLGDSTLDKLLIVHALEHTEAPRALLDECWRVLAPGGKLLVIVPNRQGVWVRASIGPFAQGRGFSAWQLRSLLADQRFTPAEHGYALYIPPTQRAWWLKGARFIEGFGRQWFKALGGVILMEAEKQLVQPIRTDRKRVRAIPLLPELLPSPAPALGRGCKAGLIHSFHQSDKNWRCAPVAPLL